MFKLEQDIRGFATVRTNLFTSLFIVIWCSVKQILLPIMLFFSVETESGSSSTSNTDVTAVGMNLKETGLQIRRTSTTQILKNNSLHSE